MAPGLIADSVAATVYIGIGMLLGAVVTRLLQSTRPKLPSSSFARAAGATASEGPLPKRSSEASSAFEEPKSKEVSRSDDCKMVLVVRGDLGMGKGKIAAQNVKSWKRFGQTKVAVKCNSESELMELEKKARQLGIPAEHICDAGRTQIEAGSVTVLAVGPAPAKLVDSVTGHLKLL